MLTSDLLRVRVVQKNLRPQLVKTTAPRHLQRAERLLEEFTTAHTAQWSRAKLEASIREIEGLSTDHKLIKGLAKVLLDRCAFSPRSLPGEDAPEPVELRERVFSRAVARAPIARRPGPTGLTTAASVIAEVAEEVGCTPAQLSAALYADLKEEQILSEADLPQTPAALLERYNVALVQSVLLRASALTLTLTGPSPARLRQLFRYLRFHQLMYRVHTKGSTVTLLVDGPQSLLKQSTRYGLQLATFFPAILLQECPWSMEAEILWGNKRKVRKVLTVDSRLGLRSHYRDRGAWRSRTEEWFEQRWAELGSSWRLHPGEVVDLGEQRILIPHYTFRRRGRTAHLDIVGFWRRGYLEKRLQDTPSNVLLAVSRRLAGETKALPKTLQEQVIVFAEIISAKKVLARLEIIAEPQDEPPVEEIPAATAADSSEQKGLWE